VLAAAGLWAYVAWQHYRASVTLAEAVAEADRLDPGWRLDDLLARRAAVPDDRNAALRVLAVTARLPANYPNPDLDQALGDPTPTARLTEPQRAALAQLLAPVAALLPEARALAQMPAGRFPLAFGPVVMPTKLHAHEPRTLLPLLRYDLLDRLEAGDRAGALTAWHAAFHAGRAIGDEPLIISQLSRVVCRGTALGLLERLLAQAEPGEADLARVQQLLEDDETAPLFLTAARGERAIGFLTLQDIKAAGAKKPTWDVWWGAARSVWDKSLTLDEAIALMPGSLPAQQAALLQCENRMVEIAKRPPEEWKPLLDMANTEAGNLPALARMIAPAFGKTSAAFLRSHAVTRCAAAAVAAERYRVRHGRWPAAWDDLVRDGLLRAAPIDPYGGRPLRLKPVADGLIVYSIGVDGSDDGGNLSRSSATPPGTDLGFRLWDAGRRPGPNAGGGRVP
jgi:hypothetical protein